MPRRAIPITKKLRFDVFRRDGFTCRYCGAQPPAVVLEIDHFHPVSQGGGNDISNLLTSCVNCNSGKRAAIVDPVPHLRPDSEIEYLAVAQEIAESARFLTAKAKRDELEGQVLGAIKAEWASRMPDGYPAPEERVLRNWIAQFSADKVLEAIRRAGPYGESGYINPGSSASYVFGILRRVHDEWSAEPQSQSQNA